MVYLRIKFEILGVLECYCGSSRGGVVCFLLFLVVLALIVALLYKVAKLLFLLCSCNANNSKIFSSLFL